MTTAPSSVSVPALLLLDLDGVVVFEQGRPHLDQLEILCLHEAMGRSLRALNAPVVVLTHRSRAEARRILRAAEFDTDVLADVMAAEDLALAALRHGSLRRMFNRGLRKSLILPEVEARHGVSRGSMVFIDDRLDNLEDLLSCGLGLGLHAPSDIGDDGVIVTFDMAEASDIFARWRSQPWERQIVQLAPRRLDLKDSGRTGLSTTRDSLHAFNYARTAARRVRRSLEALRS